MSNELQKSDLEQLLGEQTKVILDAVDERLNKVDVQFVVIRDDIKEIRGDVSAMKASIAELANTLDAFLKRLTAHEQEFDILKSEMNAVKVIFRDKFQIDIDAFRHR